MIFDDRTSVTRQSQAAFTAANLSEIDLEKLHGVRPRLTLADVGVALTRSGGGSRFQRARLCHGSGRSRMRKIGLLC